MVKEKIYKVKNLKYGDDVFHLASQLRCHYKYLCYNEFNDKHVLTKIGDSAGTTCIQEEILEEWLEDTWESITLELKNILEEKLKMLEKNY